MCCPLFLTKVWLLSCGECGQPHRALTSTDHQPRCWWEHLLVWALPPTASHCTAALCSSPLRSPSWRRAQWLADSEVLSYVDAAVCITEAIISCRLWEGMKGPETFPAEWHISGGTSSDSQPSVEWALLPSGSVQPHQWSTSCTLWTPVWGTVQRPQHKKIEN